MLDLLHSQSPTQVTFSFEFARFSDSSLYLLQAALVLGPPSWTALTILVSPVRLCYF